MDMHEDRYTENGYGHGGWDEYVGGRECIRRPTLVESVMLMGVWKGNGPSCEVLNFRGTRLGLSDAVVKLLNRLYNVDRFRHDGMERQSPRLQERAACGETVVVPRWSERDQNAGT